MEVENERGNGEMEKRNGVCWLRMHGGKGTKLRERGRSEAKCEMK